ncbi:hypothetical protein BC831DRAFT_484111, partial [Entophlyctis helioformis]
PCLVCGGLDWEVPVDTTVVGTQPSRQPDPSAGWRGRPTASLPARVGRSQT